MVAVIDPVELSDAPRVMLGGQEWIIPKLAVRQNRHVIPLVLALNGVKFETITEEQTDRIYRVCYIAMTRAEPGFTREEFEDLPVSLTECFRALPVIIEQAGMVASGNALPAAAALPGSTGTKLSSRLRAPKA